MPLLLGLDSQVIGVGIFHDHLAQFVIENHQLKQSDAALVAGVAAAAAAGTAVEFLALDVLPVLRSSSSQHVVGDFDFFAAFRTDPANQSLSQNGFDGRGDHERGNPHVFHPRDGDWAHRWCAAC